MARTSAAGRPNGRDSGLSGRLMKISKGCPFPGGGVDDRLAVRGEERAADLAARERDLAKLRRLDDAGLLAGGVEERGRDGRAERRAASASAAQGRFFPAAGRARTPVVVAPERPDSASRSNATSRADSNRSSGFFSRQCRTIRSRPGWTSLFVVREIRRLLRQDRRDRVRRRVPAERALAREHLVQDRPEGEEVGPLVRGLPAHLLGRHVAHRPEHDAGLRAAGDGAHVRLAALVLLGLELRETEVEDLDPAVLRQEQVLGLQVPVDDPLLVRRREPVGRSGRRSRSPCAPGASPSGAAPAASRLRGAPSRCTARRRACRSRRPR